jgi:hypothetical protein
VTVGWSNNKYLAQWMREIRTPFVLLLLHSIPISQPL